MKKSILKSPSAVFSLAAGVGFFCISLLPLLAKLQSPASAVPGSLILLCVGFATTLFTTGALYFGINSEINLPSKFFVSFAAYNALIIFVKIALSPLALYEFNATRPFTGGLFSMFEKEGTFIFPILIIMAGIIFLLYFISLSVIYMFFKTKAKRTLTSEVSLAPAKNHRIAYFIGLALIFSLIVLTGGSILGFTLFFGLSALEYLSYISATFLSFFIAFALVGAILFASIAFETVYEQTIALRDISLLTSFFWTGAAFLFLYHALWVVYLIILTTLWPFRVVIPSK